jgi:hypothetical protein
MKQSTPIHLPTTVMQPLTLPLLHQPFNVHDGSLPLPDDPRETPVGFLASTITRVSKVFPSRYTFPFLWSSYLPWSPAFPSNSVGLDFQWVLLLLAKVPHDFIGFWLDLALWSLCQWGTGYHHVSWTALAACACVSWRNLEISPPAAHINPLTISG